MAIGINNEDSDTLEIDDYSPEECRRALFFAIDAAIYLKASLPKADNIVAVIAGSAGVKVMKRDHAIGMEETFDVPFEDKLLLINDNIPEKGCLMMRYAYVEKLDTLFYWTTAMETIYFHNGEQI